ncbi:MAG TPA: ornithine-acyl-ACP acyltransferase, partial [Aliiroseovarius sp.]|nr:ornithine-acyl-ACP acyltransferase [Aliiroseovarius sp.]
VSDHVVVDDALRTLHVFTGLEIAAVPRARARALRALAR